MANQENPNIVIKVYQTPQVGPDPTFMSCPHCNATITTVVEIRATIKTHLLFLLLCSLGCFCCAPCIYLDGCIPKKHSCPNCHKFIGMYDY